MTPHCDHTDSVFNTGRGGQKYFYCWHCDFAGPLAANEQLALAAAQPIIAARKVAAQKLAEAKAAGEYIYQWRCQFCHTDNETPESESNFPMCGHCGVHSNFAEICTIERMKELLAKQGVYA